MGWVVFQDFFALDAQNPTRMRSSKQEGSLEKVIMKSVEAAADSIKIGTNR